MMHWYGNDPNGWGFALMAIGMLVFWGVVIGAVVVVVRRSGRCDPPTAPGGPPSPQHPVSKSVADRSQ
jgi:putative membrane protein